MRYRTPINRISSLQSTVSLSCLPYPSPIYRIPILPYLSIHRSTCHCEHVVRLQLRADVVCREHIFYYYKRGPRRITTVIPSEPLHSSSNTNSPGASCTTTRIILFIICYTTSGQNNYQTSYSRMGSYCNPNLPSPAPPLPSSPH